MLSAESIAKYILAPQRESFIHFTTKWQAEKRRRRKRCLGFCLRTGFVFAERAEKHPQGLPDVFLGSISFTHALLSNKIVAAAVATTSPRSHRAQPFDIILYAFARDRFVQNSRLRKKGKTNPPRALSVLACIRFSACMRALQP